MFEMLWHEQHTGRLPQLAY